MHALPTSSCPFFIDCLSFNTMTFYLLHLIDACPSCHIYICIFIFFALSIDYVWTMYGPYVVVELLSTTSVLCTQLYKQIPAFLVMCDTIFLILSYLCKCFASDFLPPNAHLGNRTHSVTHPAFDKQLESPCNYVFSHSPL